MKELPIHCDMTDAPDTPVERLEEYRALFAARHLRTERTPAGIRHTFVDAPGVADHLRDLTSREQACCGFLDFSVTTAGDEVHWQIGTRAGPMAEAVLEDFLALPSSLPGAQKPV